jgi:hypothetical protein
MKRAEFIARREEFSGLSIPELIDLLSSPKLEIRFLAEMCLREATGT